MGWLNRGNFSPNQEWTFFNSGKDSGTNELLEIETLFAIGKKRRWGSSRIMKFPLEVAFKGDEKIGNVDPAGDVGKNLIFLWVFW